MNPTLAAVDRYIIKHRMIFGIVAWVANFLAVVVLIYGLGGAFPGVSARFPRVLRSRFDILSPNGQNRIVLEATDEHATIRVIEGSRVEVLTHPPAAPQ